MLFYADVFLPEIDKTTIYRSINAYVRNKVLKEIHLSKEYTSYELNKEGDYHQHFMCESCKNTFHIDINLQKIKKLFPKSFNINEFELNLKGKCNNCK